MSSRVPAPRKSLWQLMQKVQDLEEQLARLKIECSSTLWHWRGHGPTRQKRSFCSAPSACHHFNLRICEGLPLYECGIPSIECCHPVSALLPVDLNEINVHTTHDGAKNMKDLFIYLFTYLFIYLFIYLLLLLPHPNISSQPQKQTHGFGWPAKGEMICPLAH